MQDPQPRQSPAIDVYAALAVACFAIGWFGFGIVFGPAGVALSIISLTRQGANTLSRAIASAAILANGWLALWAIQYLQRFNG